MADIDSTLAASVAGLAAQAARLRLAAENIANADTPGYRRKLLSFDGALSAAGSDAAPSPGRVTLDRSAPEKVYDPGNPLSGADGFYERSNVNLMIEIADAREAQRSYEANLRMFDQTRRMAGAVLELLRR
ncbi:MAG: flagellar basal body rod protein FlgC [Paracoccaceae bacterium]